jgi:hypothetical protein
MQRAVQQLYETIRDPSLLWHVCTLYTPLYFLCTHIIHYFETALLALMKQARYVLLTINRSANTSDS